MSKKFWFLTKDSLNKSIKTKWFLIANIFFLLLITAGLNIDNIINFFGGDFGKDTEILVIDEANVYNEFKVAYENSSLYILDSPDAIITKYEKSYDEAIEEITKEKNKVLVVISPDNDNYLKAKLVSKEGISTLTYTAINSALSSVRSEIVLKEYNITKEEFNNIETPVNIEREIITNKNLEDDVIVSVVMEFITVPLFMLIMYLVQKIGAEVNEEKTTKSMEIIISNVSPEVHFLSKIISANIFVFMQGILIIAYVIFGAIIRIITTGGNIMNGIDAADIESLTSEIPIDRIMSTLNTMLPILIVMIVSSFIAYSLLAGILASMTTNAEDFQQLQTPIMIFSLIGFYLSVMSGVFKGSVFIKIMSYVPLISSLLAPSLYVLGEVSLIDLLVSIGLLIGLIYLLIKYGMRIYKVGILNYSGVGLWKKMAKAIKEK